MAHVDHQDLPTMRPAPGSQCIAKATLLLLAALYGLPSLACSPLALRPASFERPAAGAVAAPPPGAPAAVTIDGISRGGNPARGDSCWDVARVALSLAADPAAHAYGFEVASGTAPEAFQKLPPLLGLERLGRREFFFSWSEATRPQPFDFELRITPYSRQGKPGKAVIVRLVSAGE